MRHECPARDLMRQKIAVPLHQVKLSSLYVVEHTELADYRTCLNIGQDNEKVWAVYWWSVEEGKLYGMLRKRQHVKRV